MPPGWKKATRSATLIQSFSVIDKHLRAIKNQRDTKDTNEDGRKNVSKIVVDMLLQVDEKEHTEEQLANILVKLKYLAMQRNCCADQVEKIFCGP